MTGMTGVKKTGLGTLVGHEVVSDRADCNAHDAPAHHVAAVHRDVKENGDRSNRDPDAMKRPVCR